MISLLDLLKISGIPLRKFKIHLATSRPKYHPTPLEAYYAGRFKEWQEDQRNLNFKCDHVIGLIHLHADQWIFAGVYRIIDHEKGTITKYRYKTEVVPGQEDLIGRVIVRYKRTFRASYISGIKYGHLLEVAEIRNQKLSIEPFPGYNRVILKHDMLKVIVHQQDASWKSALSSIKGVYLIVDTATGGAYVGSATGNDGIWQRWVDYSKNGHGDNKGLEKLLEKKGSKYLKNFQYTILEIADFHATDKDIIDRETHWKKALLSRGYGLNR